MTFRFRKNRILPMKRPSKKCAFSLKGLKDAQILPAIARAFADSLTFVELSDEDAERWWEVMMNHDQEVSLVTLTTELVAFSRGKFAEHHGVTKRTVENWLLNGMRCYDGAGHFIPYAEGNRWVEQYKENVRHQRSYGRRPEGIGWSDMTPPHSAATVPPH